MSQYIEPMKVRSTYLYADIIIDISHENLDRTFSYLIPEHIKEKVFIGMAVKIPFGTGDKLRLGYISGIRTECEIPREKLKYISEIASKEVSTEKQFIALAIWMHEYYGCTLKKALSTVMPVKNKITGLEKKWIILGEQIHTEESYQEKILFLRSKRRSAWIRLLEALWKEEKRSLDWEYISKILKIPISTLYKMETEGIIQIHRKNIYRNPIDFVQGMERKILNTEQKFAVNTFIEDYRNKMYRTYLLHGVTGSGKTEVYIEMIREVIDSGRQVIVLVPEISLTYQTVQRLVAVFGTRIAVVNSKLSDGERYDQFKKAIEHEADIMIGPRSAIFTPFDNIGLIIIDEEHDSAYQNENTPRFHTVEVAKKRAKLSESSLLLTSATPSMVSYQRALQGEYKLLCLTQRAVHNSKLARTYIVDLREELKAGNRSIFSRKLNDLIQEKLAKNEQIMLFMNRRGFSNFVSCRSCGEVIRCPHCDVSLTLHNNKRLYCHYCNYSKDMPKTCPHCDSHYIAEFGIGTQKLEILTQKAFPQARVLRLDLDTNSKKNSGKEILTKFANHEADILIGTQMIVKGHDFKEVSLVGIMAADTSLYAADYMATEKTFALLTQAAGRAGRAGLQGDVVIQTYSPTHYTIVAAAQQDYQSFYKQEFIFRKIAKYPPYIHMMTVQLSCKDEVALEMAMEKYVYVLSKKEIPNLQIIGPVNAAVYKVQDFYRKLTYIKHHEYDILLRVKREMESKMKQYYKELFKNVGSIYDFK